MTHPDAHHITRVALDANAVLLGEMTRLAYLTADRAVMADLESLPAQPLAPGLPAVWIDTRPLLDEREHAPQCIDMWADALAYARLRRIISQHPHDHHRVRIIRRVD